MEFVLHAVSVIILAIFCQECTSANGVCSFHFKIPMERNKLILLPISGECESERSSNEKPASTRSNLKFQEQVEKLAKERDGLVRRYNRIRNGYYRLRDENANLRQEIERSLAATRQIRTEVATLNKTCNAHKNQAQRLERDLRSERRRCSQPLRNDCGKVPPGTTPKPRTLHALPENVPFLPPKCLRCICEVETKCTVPRNICHQASGVQYCGPYNINRAVWVDAQLKDPSIAQVNFRDCAATFECSERIMEAYMRRYATVSTLSHQPSCEDFARIHRGGPNGFRSPDATRYWAAVYNCMRTTPGKQ